MVLSGGHHMVRRHTQALCTMHSSPCYVHHVLLPCIVHYTLCAMYCYVPSYIIYYAPCIAMYPRTSCFTQHGVRITLPTPPCAPCAACTFGSSALVRYKPSVAVLSTVTGYWELTNPGWLTSTLHWRPVGPEIAFAAVNLPFSRVIAVRLVNRHVEVRLALAMILPVMALNTCQEPRSAASTWSS